jgi:CelD/BcsL family acetyltransferase involved in cellulose biosynthesis
MSEVEIIQTRDEFESLAPECEDLMERASRVTPFQLPAWQLTWWNYFGSGAIRVFTSREHNRLVGVLPCFLHEWNGRRQLTLMGSGISDYLEPVFDPAHVRNAVSLLRQQLVSQTDWDVCDWQDLDADSPWADLGGSGLRLTAREGQVCSRIPLAGTFEDFWAARGKDLRRNVRRYGTRASEIAPVEFCVMEKPETTVLHSLITLHAARWQAKGEPGMIAANHAGKFLCDVSRKFAERDMLRLFTIAFGSKLVALSLGFLFRNAIYSYMSAFDPEQEQFGFGRRLLHDAIEWSYGHKLAYWHFLRGDEAYKFSWGAERVPKLRVVIERRS